MPVKGWKTVSFTVEDIKQIRMLQTMSGYHSIREVILVGINEITPPDEEI